MDIKIRKDHILIMPSNGKLVIKQVGNVVQISVAKQKRIQSGKRQKTQ